MKLNKSVLAFQHSDTSNNFFAGLRPSALGLLFFLLPSLSRPAPSYPLPADQVNAQVENLLAQMSLQEKLLLTSGKDNMDTPPIPRLGIPSLKMSDGPLGLRWGHSTAFPSGLCLAATWDPDLAQREGMALGQEALGHGRNMLLGPCINIVRHPLGGRGFESFGEDPWLTSRISVAYIRGVQSQGVAACVKHFAANNQETERMTVDTLVPERALREIYLPAFEASIKEASSLTIMAAYNRLNGYYCAQSPWLLNQVLKKEWGFQGLAVSDWGALHDGPSGLLAGLDIEMPGPGNYFGQRLTSYVEDHPKSLKAVEDQARRILRVMAQLDLFHRDISEDPQKLNQPSTQALAQQVAEQGAVLLKNENHTLPLPAGIKSLAIIGGNAKNTPTGGGGSSQVSPPFSISALQGLQQALGSQVKIIYASGPDIDDRLDAVPAAELRHVKAEYFNNMNLEGSPVLIRAEESIDHDWGYGAPDPSMGHEHFSARWSAQLVPSHSGIFRLGLRGDDGYRLYFNGKLLVENWHDHAAETRASSVSLTAGVSYPLVVEYYQNGGEASIQLGWQSQQGLEQAVAAARQAEAALVFTGLSGQYESEGYDRGNFSLPASQNALIQAVAQANPRTAVILVAGTPVELEPWIDGVPALLQAWYPGMLGGKALARLLLGQANPSGKLPVTFPKHLQDTPAYPNFPGQNGQVEYKEGLLVGYRYYDTKKVEPRFPFGHGLSYTTFEYSGLNVQNAGAQVVAQFTIKNTGPVAGAEVAQLYLHPPHSLTVERPEQELKAFQKVYLQPGETRRVSLSLNDRSFSYWFPAKSKWQLEKGNYEIRIGSSSRDIRLKATLKR